MRFGRAPGLSLGGANVYYGSIDAAPLFVMLVGEFSRWSGDRARVARLLPYVDRALEWIEAFGDRDGDGYVEYQRSTDHGLANQGWKVGPETMPMFWGHAAHASQGWAGEFKWRWCGGRDIGVCLRRGEVADAVLEVAETEAVDLIVLVWTQDLRPGHATVVRAALHGAHVPVLLVPSRDGGDAGAAPAHSVT
jgi:hypothetical protein